MSFTLLAAVLLVLTMMSYRLGRQRVLASGTSVKDMHSLPSYYGAYVALWCGIPAALMVLLWQVLEPQFLRSITLSGLSGTGDLSPTQLTLLLNDISSLATGGITSRDPDAAMTEAASRYATWRNISTALWAVVAIAAAIGGLSYGRRLVNPTFRARPAVERVIKTALIIASTLAILTTLGIVVSLLFEALRFFGKVPVTEFLFGLKWSPQTALRADQVGSSGSFGAVPIFAGTFLITIIAMAVAVPVGLMSAIYMSEYASRRFRAIVKPILEILAGIPTVVYGFFAALTIAPFFRGLGESVGLSVASESALAAGVVMGIMIIPFVSSLSDDVINAVPQTMRDGSFALGATHSETIRQVIIPAALPGIVGSILLACSRAIGETMIVVMAAGLAANLTANPLQAVTTVTVQIVTLLTGDQEFDSAKTLAAFALGLVLFVVTLGLNVIALRVVRKYREKYD